MVRGRVSLRPESSRQDGSTCRLGIKACLGLGSGLGLGLGSGLGCRSQLPIRVKAGFALPHLGLRAEIKLWARARFSVSGLWLGLVSGCRTRAREPRELTRTQVVHIHLHPDSNPNPEVNPEPNPNPNPKPRHLDKYSWYNSRCSRLRRT